MISNATLKKRKITINSLKNDANIIKYEENFAKKKLLSSDLKLIAWIKTVLHTKRFLPCIIKLIDKNVFDMASSCNNGSYIFDDRINGTYAQIEQLIEIEDRKLSLINMNMIADSMFDSLEKKYRDFVMLKFFKNKNYAFVAAELDVDERTLYRWNKIILTKLYKFCKLNNWTTNFFENQLQREKWILPHYEKAYKSICKLFSSK